MAKMRVTYFDLDDVEMTCVVDADDEAAAVGCVLDELGDDILSDSPFAVWRIRKPRRQAAGSQRGDNAKLVSDPVPTDAEAELDDVHPLLIEGQDPPPAVQKLLDSVSKDTGATVEVK
jgi:hypothetical protein